MKKYLCMGYVCFMMLILTACGQNAKKPAMYLEKANLTQQEVDMAKLLGANEGQRIFDFKLDKSVKTLQVNVYHLKDGTWQLISDRGQPFSDPTGRIALEFDKISDDLRIAIQSETESGSTAFSTKEKVVIEGMSRTTSMLEDLTEVVYEEEIPLAIQICTTQDAIYSYDMDYFHTPEKYAEYNYEEVYAITVRFSQKTIEELEQES